MKTIVNFLKKTLASIDWILVLAIIPIAGAGLVTMNSFVASNTFFQRQLVWLIVSFAVFFIFSAIDFKFLRRTSVIVWLFGISVGLLASLFVVGSVWKGAQSWLSFGFLSFQPAEFVKIILIILLAKYFSRRYVEIKNIRHILVSGAYAGVLFLLILVQPDFGSAIIIFLIWFGMVMVSGISKKHLTILGLIALSGVIFLWLAVFQDYQKDRILSFIHPLEDIQGAGYNAYQSTVTVGSGQLWGKGLGYGTQSRLRFLPEYQTDFIFAAYAEEWGFAGVMILFICYGIVIWRILSNAMYGATNFEIFYGIGLSILLMSHLMIHVGMNIGLLPVTGITVPFMSYGGSHLLVTFAGLGILMGMRRYSRATHRSVLKNEFFGV